MRELGCLGEGKRKRMIKERQSAERARNQKRELERKKRMKKEKKI